MFVCVVDGSTVFGRRSTFFTRRVKRRATERLVVLTVVIVQRSIVYFRVLTLAVICVVTFEHHVFTTRVGVEDCYLRRIYHCFFSLGKAIGNRTVALELHRCFLPAVN